jgi:hypothetical protein
MDGDHLQMDGEVVFGVLMLRCKETGGQINSRINFRCDELARARAARMYVRCPVCGRMHDFRFSDAWLGATLH